MSDSANWLMRLVWKGSHYGRLGLATTDERAGCENREVEQGFPINEPRSLFHGYPLLRPNMKACIDREIEAAMPTRVQQNLRGFQYDLKTGIPTGSKFGIRPP